jgi:hypothetical protein
MKYLVACSYENTLAGSNNQFVKSCIIDFKHKITSEEDVQELTEMVHHLLIEKGIIYYAFGIVNFKIISFSKIDAPEF